MTAISNTPNTMTINEIAMPIFTGVIKPDWIRAAEAKGYDFVARVLDRLHFALRCQQCKAVNKVKRYTLMKAQPLCQACIAHEWDLKAKAAGVEFLHRDKNDRHYGNYRLSCGHATRRQVGLVKRAAAGETGIRCQICLGEKMAAEAEAQGWALVGPDPKGDPNYRCYRHVACDHEQRIARVNMQTGRFGCGGCGEDWPAAPSFIYLMRFTLVTGRNVIKLGFSKKPENRLAYQLKGEPDMPCDVLHKIAVPTGQEANRIEKQLHTKLKAAHRDCLVDPKRYHDQILVKSEIYDACLTETILQHLSDIEAEIGLAVA